jgi:aldose sugar dehydrogenase
MTMPTTPTDGSARNGHRRPGGLLVGLVGLIALVAACTVPPAPGPTTTTTPGPVRDVAVTSRVTGFHRPWEIAFTPGGTLLVTERGGTLAAVVGGARHLVGAVPGVVAQGEGGLLGLAVDPGFATNRRIYTCFDFGVGGVVTDVRIVRFRVAEDLGSLTEATNVLTGIPAGAGNRHQGCRLAVGPDGMLWASTGDTAQPTPPQDPTSRAGKVLRMTPAGAPAPGNHGGAWDPYVYTLGHRNPQGLAFRPSDGAPFEVEHGTGCDDEVNHLGGAGNYGWNPVGVGYDESRPMTDLSIPGAVPAVWSSGCPTIAPSGATFVQGAQWGAWNGALAVAVLKGTRLMFVRIDGTTLEGTDARLTDEGRLRTVDQAADGSLWVAQDADPGSILRVVPAP